MGVTYVAAPLVGETLHWLESMGMEIPPDSADSRLPKFEELRHAAESLQGFDASIEEAKDGVVCILIEPGVDAPDELYARVNVFDYSGDDQSCTPVFEKGSEIVIIRVLSELAFHTGPLALVPDTGELPIVVRPGIDPDAAHSHWIQARNADET